MKNVFFITLSFALQGMACDETLKGLSVHDILYADLSPIAGVTVKSGSYAKVNNKDLKSLSKANEKLSADCVKSLYRLDFIVNEKSLSALYTNKKDCNGGTSDGVVKNAEGEVVAEIVNSVINCL